MCLMWLTFLSGFELLRIPRLYSLLINAQRLPTIITTNLLLYHQFCLLKDFQPSSSFSLHTVFALEINGNTLALKARLKILLLVLLEVLITPLISCQIWYNRISRFSKIQCVAQSKAIITSSPKRYPALHTAFGVSYPNGIFCYHLLAFVANHFIPYSCCLNLVV